MSLSSRLALLSLTLTFAACGGASSSGAGAQAGHAEAHACTPETCGKHGHGKHGMGDLCPMQLAGTKVEAMDVEGGVALSFTTTGDVAALRERVRHMAEHHAKKAEHHAKMMAEHHGEPKSAHAKLPGASVSAKDTDGGAMLEFVPKDAAELEALRAGVREKATRLAAGDCPMQAHGNKPEGQAGCPHHQGAGECSCQHHGG